MYPNLKLSHELVLSKDYNYTIHPKMLSSATCTCRDARSTHNVYVYMYMHVHI